MTHGAMAQHFVKTARSEYEFHQLAAEITILDGRGRIVWRKQREREDRPIRWLGLDLGGLPVDIGSYICKILYSHNLQEVYLPFVFMR